MMVAGETAFSALGFVLVNLCRLLLRASTGEPSTQILLLPQSGNKQPQFMPDLFPWHQTIFFFIFFYFF